jgi:hypothetical protein
MRWFYKQKRTGYINQATVNDKAASKIAGWMLGVQNKFAMVMNKGFSKLNSTKKKIAVLFFLLIGEGLSIYYICEAMIGVKKENPVERIGTFKIPKNYNQRETETKSDLLLDEDTWIKVEAFKHYMDSLKTNDPPMYEIILMERPGLMDSINTLEQIYYSQKIK